MKHDKLFRILAMAAIISLLMLAIPATSALAAESIILSPDDGPPGTLITVTGGDFAVSTSGRVWFDSNDDGNYDSGEPYENVTTESDGDIPSGVNLTVPTEPRGTYYVYADIPSGSTVEAVDAFVITPEIDLSASSGNVDDTVYVDGYGFKASTTVTIYYDGESVGTDTTDSDGTFDNFTLTIPDSTKGTHKVKAKDSSGYSPEVTFTVSPEITLSSSTGAVDDTITITGTGFAETSDITIYFSGDEVTITSGDEDTDSDGSFECTITIPDTTRGSHTIKAEDEDDNYDTATFTVAQKITIDPTSGSSGITVTVIGTGFKASYTITITYDGIQVATSPATVTTNSSGYFSATFTVPASMTGTYEVIASDGTNTATADFISTTDATIDTETSVSAPGHVGMEITITGAGFKPNATITITYESDPVEFTTTSLADGSFSYVLTIPASVGGAHTITVSDGSVSKVFDFYMELDAPSAPELLLPLIGEKSDSEAIFDWDDVDDDSEPVTYDLQIATSASFTSASILVEQEGLTESEYTLIEEEKLKSTSEDEPYYWRVRAVDAASNEGAWSDASTFYVGFTFEFAGWVVYVTMAVIAVVFFFLGWWLGRRRSIGDEFA
jgi:hypothetical protein